MSSSHEEEAEAKPVFRNAETDESDGREESSCEDRFATPTNDSQPLVPKFTGTPELNPGISVPEGMDDSVKVEFFFNFFF